MNVGEGVRKTFAVVYIIRFQCLRREKKAFHREGTALANMRMYNVPGKF